MWIFTTLRAAWGALRFFVFACFAAAFINMLIFRADTPPATPDGRRIVAVVAMGTAACPSYAYPAKDAPTAGFAAAMEDLRVVARRPGWVEVYMDGHDQQWVKTACLAR